jgi:hypothetical protein
MLLTMLLLALAIENITDILVNLDLFEPLRVKFETMFPRIGKLARCKFCQSLWLSGIATATTVQLEGVLLLASWPALHLLTHFVRVAHESSHEFLERYLNRAPTKIYILGDESRKDDNKEV